jgi:hypothetical protein
MLLIAVASVKTSGSAPKRAPTSEFKLSNYSSPAAFSACSAAFSLWIPFDPQDGDRDIAPDHDRLTSASRQNQHDFLLLPCGVPAPFFYASNLLTACNTS